MQIRRRWGTEIDFPLPHAHGDANTYADAHAHAKRPNIALHLDGDNIRREADYRHYFYRFNRRVSLRRPNPESDHRQQASLPIRDSQPLRFPTGLKLGQHRVLLREEWRNHLSPWCVWRHHSRVQRVRHYIVFQCGALRAGHVRQSGVHPQGSARATAGHISSWTIRGRYPRLGTRITSPPSTHWTLRPPTGQRLHR